MSDRAIQSVVRDADGNLPPVRIVAFTAEEQAKRDRVLTAAEKDIDAAAQAERRVNDPALLVLARAAGLTDEQFKTDVATEIRSKL